MIRKETIGILAGVLLLLVIGGISATLLLRSAQGDNIATVGTDYERAAALFALGPLPAPSRTLWRSEALGVGSAEGAADVTFVAVLLYAQDTASLRALLPALTECQAVAVPLQTLRLARAADDNSISEAELSAALVGVRADGDAVLGEACNAQPILNVNWAYSRITFVGQALLLTAAMNSTTAP
jgi:hypothetical protein